MHRSFCRQRLRFFILSNCILAASGCALQPVESTPGQALSDALLQLDALASPVSVPESTEPPVPQDGLDAPVYLASLQLHDPSYGDDESELGYEENLFSIEQFTNSLFELFPAAGKPARTDYSDYGFFDAVPEVPAVQVPEQPVAEPETAPASSVLDRIRRGFALDLQQNNPRIQVQFDWYVNNPEYLERCFTRSARYLFHVVNEVERRGMPLEIALLPFVESAYDPFAYSHGRASGLWQFIPETGRLYGLHQNWWYDGRRDVLASTKAALDYLEYLNNRFEGDWLHALAAYNSGSGRVAQAIKKNRQRQRPTDFWSLQLPRETRAYVPKLIALARLVLSPEKHGISLPSPSDEPYFSAVDIDSQLDLAQAARLAEIDVNEIYLLNPGFNQWATDPLGPHRLLVPIEKASVFEHNLSQLSPEQRLTWNRYSVRRGDTLIAIARKFHTTPELIRDVNRLKSNLIRQNQKLLIPVASKDSGFYDLSAGNRLADRQSQIEGPQGSTRMSYVVQAGDTMWELARKHKVGVRTLAKWNGMAPTDVLHPGRELLIWSRAQTDEARPIESPLVQERQMIRKIGYRVKKGDSLARIASKFSVTVEDLVVWNKLDQKKYLQPGQKLTIFVDITNS
jgi:membrane-bound lytic murein transglycosylase D